VSQLFQSMAIDHEFAGSDSSSAGDCRGDYCEAIGVRVKESGNDCVVFVSAVVLMGTIDDPVSLGWIVAIFNPEVRHLWIVGKVKAERTGEPQRPTVIEGTDEHSRAAPEVRQGRRS